MASTLLHTFKNAIDQGNIKMATKKWSRRGPAFRRAAARYVVQTRSLDFIAAFIEKTKTAVAPTLIALYAQKSVDEISQVLERSRFRGLEEGVWEMFSEPSILCAPEKMGPFLGRFTHEVPLRWAIRKSIDTLFQINRLDCLYTWLDFLKGKTFDGDEQLDWHELAIQEAFKEGIKRRSHDLLINSFESPYINPKVYAQGLIDSWQGNGLNPNFQQLLDAADDADLSQVRHLRIISRADECLFHGGRAGEHSRTDFDAVIAAASSTALAGGTRCIVPLVRARFAKKIFEDIPTVRMPEKISDIIGLYVSSKHIQRRRKRHGKKKSRAKQENTAERSLHPLASAKKVLDGQFGDGMSGDACISWFFKGLMKEKRYAIVDGLGENMGPSAALAYICPLVHNLEQYRKFRRSLKSPDTPQHFFRDLDALPPRFLVHGDKSLVFQILANFKEQDECYVDDDTIMNSLCSALDDGMYDRIICPFLMATRVRIRENNKQLSAEGQPEA